MYDEHSEEVERLKREIEADDRALKECRAEILRLRSVIRELEEQKSFSIPLADGHCIQVEATVDSNYKEVNIGIAETDSKAWVQDLCIVREAYGYNESGNVKPKSGVYEIYVYGDECCEDYTDRFEVPLYKDPESES